MPKKAPKPIILYRYYHDKSDFEGIQCLQDGKDIVINWLAAGSGQLRTPVVTPHDGRVIVTWEDIGHSAFWIPPVRVVGGAGMPVVLAKG